MPFTDPEREAFRRLADLALKEDLGEQGDRTSQAVIPAEREGRAVLVARSPGVVAGLPAAEGIFALVDPRLTFQVERPDGSRVQAGDRLATISGPLRSLLTAERTALNFLQRLSGVATRTRAFVDAVAGTQARILDTRKTTPGWRLLEKYAVRQGGGTNHRMGLFDGVLIKDNHLAGLAAEGTSVGQAFQPDTLRTSAVARAVRLAREKYGTELPVEVEVDTLAQFDEALQAGPEVILLDNMAPEQLAEAVRRRDAAGVQTLLEASGGVNLDTVGAIARTGVDRISVGAMTHSAPALDIALDYLS
jgi:nicotinate-nucleotide pyrophosphorylase (carboxylating)